MDNIISVWTMAKRYISGAVVGAIVAVLAGFGINETATPEIIENLRVAIDGLLMAIFYIVVILWKSWRQKKVIDAGGTLPERVESESVAHEHRMAVKR